MTDRQKFPWARVMQVGIGGLGLTPSEFWRSTLREISTASGTAHAPLHRPSLEQLMQQFPDQE